MGNEGTKEKSKRIFGKRTKGRKEFNNALDTLYFQLYGEELLRNPLLPLSK